MIKGSCCCGAVQFCLASTPNFLTICHCSRCRKLGSSEYVLVDSDSFRWLAGKKWVAEYVPPPPFKYRRSFCTRCGSSLGEVLSGAKQFPITANCLDGETHIQLWFHEHIASKPNWQIAHDHLQLFSGEILKI